MNRLLTPFLKYTFILLALSFALPLFSQHGPPRVRKEADDGFGDPTRPCSLFSNSGDQTSTYYIEVDDPTPYLNCNLHAGYETNGTPLTYIPITNFVQQANGTYKATLTITISESELNDACDGEDGTIGFWVGFGLYCYTPNVYYPIPFQPSLTLEMYNLCCEEELDPTGSDGPTPSEGPNRGLQRKNNVVEYNSFQQDSGNKATENPISLDYYVYDVSGNQATILKGISKTQNIQQVLWDTGLRTGIYFIKYLEDGEIKTKKVFKP